jgi:DNA helicase-2/ATP-dependent DNA helicase PcrA
LSYSGRIVVFQLIAEARRLQEGHGGAKAWLLAAAPAFAKILVGADLMTSAEADLFGTSVNEMLRDMQGNRVDIENLTLDDLGVYASPNAALKLLTLHNAKGREFDAVALIDLHEGRIPNFRATTAEQIAEARRLLYVGITRARRFLLFATDGSDRRNRPSRFLLRDGGIGVC